jgi:aldose 1-epimerase
LSRFYVNEKKFGSSASIQLFDDQFESSIEISQIGATLLGFSIKAPFGPLNLIDGFRDEEELQAGIGARSWIMAPFSNRIRNNRYTFNGTEYILSEADRSVMYGLVHDRNFSVSKLDIADDYAQIDLLYENLGAEFTSCYPFNVDVIVTYRLRGNTLQVVISGTNKGDIPAPFGAGWHPYFRIGDKPIDNYILTIPAEKVVLTDSHFIPFISEMAFTPLSNLPGSDFRPVVYTKKRMLGRRQLNVCYSHLIPNFDNKVVTKIECTDSSSLLTITQNSGCIYCYSGDDLSVRPRYGLAIEPVEFMTDAFNRPELQDAITLLPEQTREFAITVEYK